MTAANDKQNVWFGVAMFLMGLIAGIVLTFASGAKPLSAGGKTPPKAQAPSSAPAQVVASVQDRMLAFAKDIGLDEEKFKECVGGTKYTQEIADEESAGAKAGINGTPGNIIYNLKSKNGLVLSGARPAESFQKYVDELLKNPNFNPGKDSTEVTKAGNVPAIDLEKDHIFGNKDAQVAIIEYSDFQCPFCHRVHPTYKQLMDQNGDKVMWVYRHFPLNFHPDAQPLAIGSECANELGGNDAFWQFTDKVMEAAGA